MERFLFKAGNGRFAPAWSRRLAFRGRFARFKTAAVLAAFVPTMLLAEASKSSGTDPHNLPDDPAPLAASRPSMMPPPIAAQMSRWVAQLADNDPEQRQAALDALMMLDRSDLDALRKTAMNGQPLLPCQILAIHQAVIQVFLASEKYASDSNVGFLGLSWPDPEECSCPEGLIVGDRIPGLCAYRMLRTGDIIAGSTHDPARGIHTIEELKATVSAIIAGHTLSLQVLRFGKVIDVPIVLDYKPIALGTIDQETWTSARLRQARQYWKTEFAMIDMAGCLTEPDEELSDAIATTQPLR